VSGPDLQQAACEDTRVVERLPDEMSPPESTTCSGQQVRRAVGAPPLIANRANSDDNIGRENQDVQDIGLPGQGPNPPSSMGSSPFARDP
jgi:hypothetical protein